MPKRRFRIILDGEVYEVEVDDNLLENIEDILKRISKEKEEERPPQEEKLSIDSNVIVSPITGKVVEIRVKENTRVTEETIILIIEAMKTQIEIKAGKNGIVKKLYVKEGDVIKEGKPIALIQ